MPSNITPENVMRAADTARAAEKARAALLGEEFSGSCSVLMRDPRQVKEVADLMGLHSYEVKPSFGICQCSYDGILFFAMMDRG